MGKHQFVNLTVFRSMKGYSASDKIKAVKKFTALYDFI